MNYTKVLTITSFIISSFAFSMGGSAPEPTDPETASWQSIVIGHGGVVVNPNSFSQNSNGFKSFMNASGIRDFSAIEIITPHNRSAANSCNLNYLLPQRKDWVRGAALVLWAQNIADAAGDTPYIRNWYRPTCYNTKVGGANSSDHLTARAIDMDFSSSSARRKAQKWLCQFWNSPMNMQIGLGRTSIHLGAESPRGKRNWFYSSYSDGDEGRTCFDQ